MTVRELKDYLETRSGSEMIVLKTIGRVDDFVIEFNSDKDRIEIERK